MIFTERQITVRNGKSLINEPVILYRGDFEVSIRFTIMESKFRFKSGVNLVDSEKASFGQLAILAPYGGNVFSELVKCEDGTVTFTLTKEMIDQLEEVGLYSFQIRLFDYYRESRVSIPPVEFGIEVREPVASEDHDNSVNNAIVGYSIAKVVDGLNEDVPDTFDANGNYNKTDWETGDRITEGKLNKIEDALDKINQNEKNDVAALDKKVNSNYNILNSVKADVSQTNNMQQQINNLVLGAVGDGNNAEVIQARGSFDLLNTRLDSMDTQLNMANKGEIAFSVIDTAIHYPGYIMTDNNIVSQDPHYVYTDKMPVQSGAIDYCVHTQKEVWILQFFNANGEFISGVSTSKSTMYELTLGSAQPPADAKYVVCCWANSIDNGATTVNDSYIHLRSNMVETVENIKKDINWLEKQFSDTVDLFYGVNTQKGYMNTSYTITEDDNWVTTDFIDVRGYDEITVRVVSHQAVLPVVFYDSDKKIIGNLSNHNKDVDTTLNVSPPNGTVFIRVSSASSSYSNYVPLSITTTSIMTMHDVTSEISRLDFEIKQISSNEIDLLNTPSIGVYVGYLHTDGVSITAGDSNWFYTDFIRVNSNDVLTVEVIGHTDVGSICYYDDDKKFMQCVKGTGVQSLIQKSETITNSGYIRLSGGTIQYGKIDPIAKLLNDNMNRLNALYEDVEILKDATGVRKESIAYISPYKVYTTCNDVGGRKGHNRNYAAAIYLDHFFNGFTEEKHIRFGNDSDKVVVFSPMMVTDSNETNPTVQYNEGANILTKNKEYLITGNDIADTTFSFTHVSTLNSKTVNVVPRVLCIGDSITYAELAEVNDDDHSQNWAYHLMCKELYMKDNIDNGGSGYDIKFLGHFRKTRKMEYKDSEYDVVTYHEGIRGISLSSYLNGGVSDFRSSTTGKFSLNAWLSKYRTLDDNGNRLTLGNGTGSAITSANLSNIDVCTPTHVLIMLGANGGGTINDYKELVSIIKSEYPNMIIGLAIPDCSGTYFPSLHPNCDEKMTIWNDTGNQGNRHHTMYGVVEMLQNEFCKDEYEDDNIYFVPFYFVQPTAESCSMRKVNLPCSEIELMHHNIFTANYGWCASTHVNGIGHMNWAYQLYSWLKYTTVKNL